MESQKGLTVAQNNLPMEPPDNTAWGAEGVDTKDTLIPMLLLMQGMSGLVLKQRKCQVGQFVNSVTHEVLGDDKNPIEIIPVSTFKTWVLYEKLKTAKGNSREWKGTVNYDANNSHWLREEVMPNGTIISRDEVLNFFVLLPRDIGKLDIKPYLLAFRRTGYKTGQKLSTFFRDCQRMRVPPASRVFKLSQHMKEGDEGAYCVPDLELGRATQPQEVKVAYSCYLELAKGTHQVDESDLKSDSGEVLGARDVTGVTSESKF